MSTLHDDHVAAGRWEFDEDVTARFDDMLARSIPDHEGMRALCADVAGAFLPAADGKVLDVGCSRGEAIAQLAGRDGGALHEFVGLEVSEPMIVAARERFDGFGNVQIAEFDLRRDDLSLVAPHPSIDVVLSVLTLQFTPIEHRQRILAGLASLIRPGGALILVEKVLGSSAALDDVLVETYLDHKRAAGYTEEQITAKRHALEGVLVPVTARWNEELLERAGFREVDCFWRRLNFAGWVAVR